MLQSLIDLQYGHIKSKAELEILHEQIMNKIKDRKYSGSIDFKLPISRLMKVDNKLKKHPFYNFGRKDIHIR